MDKTVVIQIGNSDDKLPQHEWAAFVLMMSDMLHRKYSRLHFAGGSESAAQWQNYCWVLVANESGLETLCDLISVICGEFRQDSVAVTIGDTRFVSS